MPTDAVLNTPNVDKLVTLVEESTRATEQNVARFVEPAQGTLARATSKRHHIVFGRRGSGKTSLLRKAAATLTIDRRPIAFVDMESFKGHVYPDVLISVLIATFEAFMNWLANEGRTPTKAGFWKRLFGQAPTRPPLNKQETDLLLTGINGHLAELRAQLFTQDGAPIRTVNQTAGSESASIEAKLTVKAPGFGGAAGGSTTSRMEASSEQTEEFKRSKVDFLNRRIMDYQGTFRRIADLAGGDAYLFLDDLYHISRKYQPDLLDYFHRIAKNNRLWLKIGTIRHRTDWYRHGDPPLGMKLGDEADDIDLDLTLEKYGITKSFLFRVLETFATEADVSLNEILAEGARDRLVIASGGVARDFLTIFRRSVDVARERDGGTRGPKIGAEDVNRASGEHDQSKRDELRRDTQDERQNIEAALADIVEFCTRSLSNCFLVERDRHEQYVQLIAELVDMRLIHLVRSRTSVRHRKGDVYIAYMLDLSQYTGDRKRRDLTMIPFWEGQGEDQLRLVKYVYDPARPDQPVVESSSDEPESEEDSAS